MCDLCGRYPCMEGCPNQTARSYPIRKRCFLCGSALPVGDVYYEKGKQYYCQWCLSAADSEALVRICKITFSELLKRIGFEEITGKDDFDGEKGDYET